QRKVYLDGFWIDKTEVTNQQYQKFVQATGHRTALYWLDGKLPTGQET
ncbi:MAG: serine/threonine protein kinase, partial [Acidobacteria bacterium]